MLCWHAGSLVWTGGVNAAGARAFLVTRWSGAWLTSPCGWHPTMLHVSVRRYRCETCAHVWRQNMSAAADPCAKLSRAAVRWALTGVVVHHLTVARISQALGVSWNTANTAVLGEGARLLINDPARFEGVRVIGVDEHVWRHTPLRRQVRHRHLGLDSYTRPSWSLPAPGYDSGPIQAGLQNLAGLPAPHVARAH